MRVTTQRELILALASSAALSSLLWFPALRDLDATGFGDWQMIQHNWEAAYVSLLRFHEWPLWDPFHCGGVSILRNPESQLYAPWFLLAFPFGTVIAVKLTLIAHSAIGLFGMYLLARRRFGLGVLPSSFAAITWAYSGFFAWNGAGGHATLLPFAYTPLVVYAIRERCALRTAVALHAGLLVLTLYEGGTYPLPYFALLTIGELALRVARTRRPLPALGFAATSFTITALAGAIRFVPIAIALRDYPRQVGNQDALALSEVLDMLTLRVHPWRVAGHPFVWAEYGSYIGWPCVLLAAVGCMIALRRGPRGLVLGLCASGLLMLGNLGPYAPFSLLHRLPVFDSLRVPSRFAVFFTFYATLLAAHALRAALCAVRRPRLMRPLGALFVLGCAIDSLAVASPIADHWDHAPLSAAGPAEHFHLVALDYYRYYASYPRLNLGTPICYVGGMNWVVSHALWLGDQPQLRVAHKAGRVLSSEQTPNQIRALLDLPRPARVIFNQNFASGFVANSGQLASDRGRLALDLPAGRQSIEISYRPSELLPSAAISCMGLGLLAWLYASARRRAR